MYSSTLQIDDSSIIVQAGLPVNLDSLSSTPFTLNFQTMSLALCSSALFFLVKKVTAIGGNKVNITDIVGFVQEDNERDTISLLISCFATLGLCVYSAVHLNIPRKGEGNYRVLLKELQWCILGLFAPELILYTAWRQLASARQLCLEIENKQVSSRAATRLVTRQAHLSSGISTAN